MSDKKYHHGNLKIALIEAGIEMINECGEAGLSLRKVAAKCNVSQAAPYAHFKNKEDLIHAMQQHVTEQFMQILEASVKSEKKDRLRQSLKWAKLMSFFSLSIRITFVFYSLHHICISIFLWPKMKIFIHHINYSVNTLLHI